MEGIYFIGSVLNFLGVLVQGTWNLSPIGLFTLPIANPVTQTPAFRDRGVQTISPPYVLSAGDDFGRDRRRYYTSGECKKCHHDRDSHRDRDRYRYYASGECKKCHHHRSSHRDRSGEMKSYSTKDRDRDRGRDRRKGIERFYRDEDSDRDIDRDRDKEKDRQPDRDTVGSSRGVNDAADDILILDKHNLEREIKKNRRIMVSFTSTDCIKCDKFKPIFKEISKELIRKDSDVKLAKADITTDQELLGSYGSGWMPILVFFKDGRNLPQYEGPKEKKAVLDWINDNAA